MILQKLQFCLIHGLFLTCFQVFVTNFQHNRKYDREIAPIPLKLSKIDDKEGITHMIFVGFFVPVLGIKTYVIRYLFAGNRMPD